MEISTVAKSIAYGEGVALEKGTYKARCRSLGRGAASDVLAASRARRFGLTLC